MSNIATLSEIRDNWTINDLLDAHECLDIKDYMEDWHMKQSKANNGNR